MGDGNTYVVKNKNHRPCKTCGGDHEYLTGVSQDTGGSCDTPVGFSEEVAKDMAEAMGGEIERAAGMSVIILDDSARKLPRGKSDVQLMIQETETFTKAG